MNFELSAEEAATITRAQSLLYSGNPLIMRSNSSGLRIAAVRYALAVNTKGIARVLDSDLQRLLCKMVEQFPDARSEYAVTSVLPEWLMKHELVTKLVPVYVRYVSNDNVGYWANKGHEHIIYMLAKLSAPQWKSPNTVVVVQQQSLRDLMAAYDTQRAGINTAKAQAIPVRTAAIQDMLNESSDQDRRKFSRDIAGTCYQCSAPKSRGTTCVICGYTPRTARND